MRTPGKRSRYAAMGSARYSWAKTTGAFSRIKPCGSSPVPAAAAVASSAADSRRAPCSASASPSGVSASLRVVRSSSRTPSRSSRAETRALTTDFETPSLAAAPVNDFASTTRAKKISARISSGEAAIRPYYRPTIRRVASG